MKLFRFFLAILLLANLLLPLRGSSETKSIAESIDLDELVKKENLLAMSRWDVGEETLVCIVRSHKKNVGDSIVPFRKLTFYRMVNYTSISIYEFETADNFLSMYPLREVNGNLVTVWVSGSAYHFNIFSFADKKVKLVLEDGAKLMPEIVDLNNDGTEEILVSTESWWVDKKGNKVLVPSTTRIYKWVGNSYKPIKTVPWKKRLRVH